jgi:hypothetical protein
MFIFISMGAKCAAGYQTCFPFVEKSSMYFFLDVKMIDVLLRHCQSHLYSRAVQSNVTS